MPLQPCLAEHRKQEVLVEPSMVILARGVYLATSSFTLRTTAWREITHVVVIPLTGELFRVAV